MVESYRAILTCVPLIYVNVICYQDVHIANTPFHGLKMREREILKARRQLLTMMGDLLREAAGQRERENSEREQQCSCLFLKTNTKDCYFVFLSIPVNHSCVCVCARVYCNYITGAASSNAALPCESPPPITEKHRYKYRHIHARHPLFSFSSPCYSLSCTLSNSESNFRVFFSRVERQSIEVQIFQVPFF